MIGAVRLDEVFQEAVSGEGRNGGLGARPLMSVGIGDGAHEENRRIVIRGAKKTRSVKPREHKGWRKEGVINGLKFNRNAS